MAETDLNWPETAEGCRLEDLVEVIEESADFPTVYADDRIAGVPSYSAEVVAACPTGLCRELAGVLLEGSGVVVVRRSVAVEAVDRATAVFQSIIEQERQLGLSGGDHYAKPGANDRIWNAAEKLALAAPDVFVDYYGSASLAVVCAAWLGPGYQLTSQVNVINPGGAAQMPHRDYHLGFMTEAEAASFPRHAHLLSPSLTLQGAVAHGPMPIESGPTKLLPHSHKYPPGYLAWRRPDFIDYFERSFLQIPLEVGDALFFNPAVFHAGGENRTSSNHRMANLLQVSSAMGRAMEGVDRKRMTLALYNVLQDRLARGSSVEELRPVVAASAEGYPFPADLDQDQPVDRLTPPSQAELVLRALESGWSLAELEKQL